MNGRPWQPWEREFIRAHRPHVTGQLLAACLRRTHSSVSQQAIRLGLPRKWTPIDWDKVDPVIRRRHAEQWSDSEIAAEVAIDRRYVGERRERLGLPANGNTPRRRERVRQKTRQQLADAGLDSLADVLARRYREFARSRGWPADLAPRAVQILDVLYEQGPKTRRELCAAIGMTWKGSRKSLTGNGPGGSYLATLQRRGLVVRLGRQVKSGDGRGAHCNLYAVPPDVVRGSFNQEETDGGQGKKQRAQARRGRRARVGTGELDGEDAGGGAPVGQRGAGRQVGRVANDARHRGRQAGHAARV